MACQSVAVSTANVNVLLSFTELAALVKQIAGNRAVSDARQEGRYFNRLQANQRRAFVEIENTWRVVITQTQQDNGKVDTEFTVDNGDTFASEQALQPTLDALRPIFDRAFPVANQRAVLSRLAQLGKLSNIQQSSAGVSANIAIQL